MISVVNIKPSMDEPLYAEPDNATPTGRAAPAPPPAAPILPPELANRRKFSLDGKSLTLRGAGSLLDIFALNLSAGTRYLMLFFQDSLPADGTRPDRVWTLATLTTAEKAWSNGIPFKTGATLALSSTLTALTVVTAADGIFDATYLIP